MIKEAKVKSVLSVPAGVEATLRTSQRDRFLFLLNHNDRTAKISLGRMGGMNLVTGRKAAGSLALAPLDVAVIRVAAH